MISKNVLVYNAVWYEVFVSMTNLLIPQYKICHDNSGTNSAIDNCCCYSIGYPSLRNSNIRRTKSQNLNVFRLCPIYWIRVLSWECRCNWSSVDRWCSNYIWVINNWIAHIGATYIRDLTLPRTRTVRNLVRPLHPFQFPNHFENLHNHHALCKMTKWMGN